MHRFNLSLIAPPTSPPVEVLRGFKRIQTLVHTGQAAIPLDHAFLCAVCDVW